MGGNASRNKRSKKCTKAPFLSLKSSNVLLPATKYSAEKEEKAKQESKQKKLLQIEEAKKAAAEKGPYTFSLL